VKFVAPGTKPQVRVWSERVDEFIRVNFQDNGIGIPEKSQGRIFEMFHRLNDRQSYEGTGVGLTIVRRAMQRTGGRVGVRSTVGAGSTFWLDLPAA
jgi:signal transduction histidine kinase